jgi:hypothetical protein
MHKSQAALDVRKHRTERTDANPCSVLGDLIVYVARLWNLMLRKKRVFFCVAQRWEKREASVTIFVTGTDTGVGKTFVSGLLARALVRRGYTVLVQKWVSTGNRERSEDLEFAYGLIHRAG